MNTDPTRYQDEGYCVFPRLLEQPVVRVVAQSLDRMVNSIEEGRRLESLVEPHVHASDWQVWLELVRSPAILRAVRSVLGTSELLFLSSHLLVKQPLDGLEVRWHQDNTYWPSVTGTDVCTVWIALERADRENSCMRVIPRTHEGFRIILKSHAQLSNHA
ncbi:MAG: phytanoyl-CoA dioxygenase family protein [Planctomycetota bacterium]